MFAHERKDLSLLSEFLYENYFLYAKKHANGLREAGFELLPLTVHSKALLSELDEEGSGDGKSPQRTFVPATSVKGSNSDFASVRSFSRII